MTYENKLLEKRLRLSSRAKFQNFLRPISSADKPERRSSKPQVAGSNPASANPILDFRFLILNRPLIKELIQNQKSKIQNIDGGVA
jgi:hypothetical protein